MEDGFLKPSLLLQVKMAIEEASGEGEVEEVALAAVIEEDSEEDVEEDAEDSVIADEVVTVVDEEEAAECLVVEAHVSLSFFSNDLARLLNRLHIQH